MEIGTAKESDPVRAVSRAGGPFLLLLVASCAGPGNAPGSRGEELLLLNRVTWGANPSSARELARVGPASYLEAQLQPAQEAALPPEVQAQVGAMTIARCPVDELAKEMESRRKGLDLLRSDDEKKAAQQAYQQELTRLGREAGAGMLLRALYSPDQLREQMPWFWMNHFNVFQFKANLGALVADYEERAIRPHALGRFRDLLGATARHPAMLIYLDNAQNAANRINENYARELMELHTLGVEGGYTQRDVQELARVLTGVGVARDVATPNVKRKLKTEYVRDGLFEFMPHRHDYGDKVFLEKTIHGRGLAEVNEAAWASPGQLSTRFEIAKEIGSGSAGLFRTEGLRPFDKPAFPKLANALYYESLQKTLSASTQQVLEQAGSAQEWNMLLLSAP